MQERLPHINVTDGCIYIAAEIKEPGVVLMSGKIFRVVYGLRKGTAEAICAKVMPVLKAVEKDLEEAAITPLLSDCIERDALQKFSFVSPMAALGAAYDIPAKVRWIKGLRVSVSGHNLFTATKYSGWNPDVNCFGVNARSYGVDYGSYPVRRLAVLGLSVRF
jgi:hypothetical protein